MALLRLVLLVLRTAPSLTPVTANLGAWVWDIHLVTFATLGYRSPVRNGSYYVARSRLILYRRGLPGP